MKTRPLLDTAGLSRVPGATVLVHNMWNARGSAVATTWPVRCGSAWKVTQSAAVVHDEAGAGSTVRFTKPLWLSRLAVVVTGPAVWPPPTPPVGNRATPSLDLLHVT